MRVEWADGEELGEGAVEVGVAARVAVGLGEEAIGVGVSPAALGVAAAGGSGAAVGGPPHPARITTAPSTASLMCSFNVGSDVAVT